MFTIAMARAGRPGLRITGGAKESLAPPSPARKRMLPERSRTTLSTMPLPVRSARNGVLLIPTAMAAEAGSKAVGTRIQEDADRAVVVAHGHQVGQAVAVDVRHHGLDRLLLGGEGQRGLKRAVAVVQQHAHRVVARVGGRRGRACRRR